MNARTKSWFTEHKPDATQAAKWRLVEEAASIIRGNITESDDHDFVSLAEAIELHCDGSREQALSLMRLREAWNTRNMDDFEKAMFWAREAIVNP